MHTESSSVEGHAALLKLHSGAHLSRSRQLSPHTRVVHTHQNHRKTQNTTGCSRAQAAHSEAQNSSDLKIRRRSSFTTKIWYPGMNGENNVPAHNGPNPDSTNTDAKHIYNETFTASAVSAIKTEDIPHNHDRKRSLGYGYKPPLESLLPTSAKEFDFDSDEADEEEREKEAKAQSLRALQTDNYIKMCKMQGTTPCGSFKRQITDCVADVSNSLLGTKDIKSICVSLTSNVTIKELDLSGNDLSAKGACYVAEALRENTTVEDLSLCQCNIDLEGLRSLADVFLNMKPMKRIDLSKNKFESKHAEVISEVIQKNDYMEEFVLSGNKFDDVSGVSIGKALGSNVGIKKLDLSWNHLRRGGARAVCMALKFNQTIEELDLSWNGLADEGCKALGVSLPCNHTLRELDISCNRIGVTCLKEFLKGMENNDHLKVLRIDQNPLTTEGAIALIRCLEKSKVSELSDLYMTDIPINPEFLDHLDDLLKVRKVQVYHRDPNKKKITPIIRSRTLKDYDPAMILFEYMKQENLRLIDLFRTFDTDSSQTVSKEELKEGFVTINMPLTEEALDSLFERLDLNCNHEIEYDEYKIGYRKTMKKIRNGMNSDDSNDVDAVKQLKSLVKKALDDRRQEKLLQLKGKRRQRQASLTAVFQVASGKLIQRLTSHNE